MANIGERIRARRLKLGWTVQKTATLAELSQSFVSRVESGKCRYSPDSLLKIAGALGISVAELHRGDSNVEFAAPDTRSVPLLDSVQAGAWREVNEKLMDGEIREMVPVNLDYPPSTFAMRIEGDSMEPRFRQGDIIVVNPTISPRPGSYVVATEETGEATFKQYRDVGLNEHGQKVFELVPMNPHYAAMRSDRHPLAIVGVVVEHRQYFHR